MALNTEKCNAWVERDKKVFAPTQHLSYYPMVIKKVDQDVIYDEDDNQYIDFLSSASSLNLSSGQPTPFISFFSMSPTPPKGSINPSFGW